MREYRKSNQQTNKNSLIPPQQNHIIKKKQTAIRTPGAKCILPPPCYQPPQVQASIAPPVPKFPIQQQLNQNQSFLNTTKPSLKPKKHPYSKVAQRILDENMVDGKVKALPSDEPFAIEHFYSMQAVAMKTELMKMLDQTIDSDFSFEGFGNPTSYV